MTCGDILNNQNGVSGVMKFQFHVCVSVKELCEKLVEYKYDVFSNQKLSCAHQLLMSLGVHAGQGV